MFYAGCVLTGLGVGSISLASREFRHSALDGCTKPSDSFIHGGDRSSQKSWAAGRILRNHASSWRGSWVLDQVSLIYVRVLGKRSDKFYQFWCL